MCLVESFSGSFWNDILPVLRPLELRGRWKVCVKNGSLSEMHSDHREHLILLELHQHAMFLNSCFIHLTALRTNIQIAICLYDVVLKTIQEIYTAFTQSKQESAQWHTVLVICSQSVNFSKKFSKTFGPKDIYNCFKTGLLHLYYTLHWSTSFFTVSTNSKHRLSAMVLMCAVGEEHSTNHGMKWSSTNNCNNILLPEMPSDLSTGKITKQRIWVNIKLSSDRKCKMQTDYSSDSGHG